MGQASFSDEEGNSDTFDPALRARDRLTTIIFKETSVFLSDDKAMEFIIELLPYMAVALHMSEANEAMLEIIRRQHEQEE